MAPLVLSMMLPLPVMMSALAALPSAPTALIASVPPLSVTVWAAPPKVFAPLSVSEPAPLLVRLGVPETTLLTSRFWLASATNHVCAAVPLRATGAAIVVKRGAPVSTLMPPVPSVSVPVAPAFTKTAPVPELSTFKPRTLKFVSSVVTIGFALALFALKFNVFAAPGVPPASVVPREFVAQFVCVPATSDVTALQLPPALVVTPFVQKSEPPAIGATTRFDTFAPVFSV